MSHNMRVLAVGDHFFIISKLNKTSCFKSRHFINIYIINRTLHGRLGIPILSSRAESISHSFASLTRERYLQHSKIKLVSPRGHVISSISLLPPNPWECLFDVDSCIGLIVSHCRIARHSKFLFGSEGKVLNKFSHNTRNKI